MTKEQEPNRNELERNIIAQLGFDDLKTDDAIKELLSNLHDISYMGCQSGAASGFVYYSNCVEFCKNNYASIWELLQEYAESTSNTSIFEQFKYWNTFKDYTFDEHNAVIVTAVLFSLGEFELLDKIDDKDYFKTVATYQILNSFAWAAVESFAGKIGNIAEDEGEEAAIAYVKTLMAGGDE